MELLVIGIDGGDERIFSHMKMPNLQKILKNNKSYETQEDLCSRGWAEMLSGKHAIETGAFYMKPKLDGSRNVTDGYNTLDYQKNERVIPLWELLNNNGKSVGFMNIPTTRIAPKVDGFFVSGAGGGLVNASLGIPKEYCCPEEAAEILNTHDYILDTRLMPSGIKEMQVFLKRLKDTMTKRTECYIALNDKYDVDVGFIAYVATQRIQYAAMSEIEEIIENNGIPQNELQKEIMTLFYEFDLLIGDLVKKIHPEKIMIVSDHGQSKYLYNINYNCFLKEIGLYGCCDNDKAFGLYYMSGIYINDNRFEGTVSEEEKEKYIDKIITAFNAHPQSQRFSMKASKYRSCHMDTEFNDLLPDIWIDKPDYMQSCDWGEGYISMNKHYGPIYGLRSIEHSVNSGLKGAKAIMSAPFDFDNISEDLTGVYQIIEHYIKTL